MFKITTGANGSCCMFLWTIRFIAKLYKLVSRPHKHNVYYKLLDHLLSDSSFKLFLIEF